MKKILSVLLAIAMIFSVMTAGVVNASAASIFSGAKKLEALDAVSISAEMSATDKAKITKYYKITLSDSGKIKFHADSHDDHSGYIAITLYDSNGNTIIEPTTSYVILEKKEYQIAKKGTYYIRIDVKRYYHITNFYYTFEPDNTPTISIAVKMDVGDELDVAATVNNYNGKVSWKTTKKAVATVSKGKIIAKKKGKAKIRAYMDNGTYAEIVVIVRDDDE